MKGPYIAVSQVWLDRNPYMKDIMFTDPDLFLDMLFEHYESMPAERIALREMDGKSICIEEHDGWITINPIN